MDPLTAVGADGGLGGHPASCDALQHGMQAHATVVGTHATMVSRGVGL